MLYDLQPSCGKQYSGSSGAGPEVTTARYHQFETGGTEAPYQLEVAAQSEPGSTEQELEQTSTLIQTTIALHSDRTKWNVRTTRVEPSPVPTLLRNMSHLMQAGLHNTQH